MKRSHLVAGLVIAVLAGGGVWWWNAKAKSPGRDPGPLANTTPNGSSEVLEREKQQAPEVVIPPPVVTATPELSAGEKRARVERIARDYVEMTVRFAGEFAGAGKDFPGGVSAYLRQLALMEREKWTDIAEVLSPRELEDLQMTELRAGKAVQQWLKDVPATDEQRRAVFRLGQAFDDRFALTLDTTPAALYEREQARHEMLVAVAGVLGETALFPAWMRSEGADYGRTVAFVAERGLPAATAFALWELRHDFTAGRLKATIEPGRPAEQVRAAQAELVAQTRARLESVLGAEGVRVGAETGVLNWLPGK